MKSFKSFIGVLAAINVLGAIACLVIMFVSKSTGDAFWPTYIPVSVSLFVNAIVFAFIDDLAGRVDKIEEILKVKGITLEELNKKPEPKEQQTVFRPGEPIKLACDMSELLGHERIIYTYLKEEERVVIKVNAKWAIKAGDTNEYTFNLDRINIFDPETTENILFFDEK